MDLVAWLARLDAAAKRSPKPVYVVYLLVKWYLVAAGAFGLTMWYLHKIGLPSLWMD